MVQAVQFPDCTNIGKFALNKRNQRVMLKRPMHAGFNVGVPVNRFAEVENALEDGDFVTNDGICLSYRVRNNLGKMLFDKRCCVREVCKTFCEVRRFALTYPRGNLRDGSMAQRTG